MQPILPSQIASRPLAALLNVSERAVHLRAKKEGWPRIYKRVQGGPSHLYMVSGLPDEVRSVLVGNLHPLFNDQAKAAGHMRAMEMRSENSAARSARQQTKEAGLAAYERLPDKRKAEAAARREILRARDAFIKAACLQKKKGTMLFIREYKAGAIRLPESVDSTLSDKNGRVPLSWASMYRWEKAYEEGGLAGLANGYKGNRESSIPGHMQDFIKGLLYDRPHLGITMIHQAVEARFDGQDIPGRSSVRRFVDKWRTENASLILYTTSYDQWRNLHMIAQGQADEPVLRLNQIWEFDSTPGDVMLTDGRHSLIGVIDVYSRRAKLHVTPTSKSAAIAALTRRALLDWGVPEIAKTDNGSDYVSSHMVRVFEDLEIEQVLCREFHPEDKPHIERFFKTVLHSIFEMLPGYIGHSVAERQKIRDRQSFAQRILKQGEDPVEIKMTSEELQVICDRWCEAMYHHNIHGNLNGKTPFQMAREWTAPIRRIGNERTLDILLAPAPDKEGTREIVKKGIKVDNAWFLAPELGPHVGKTAFVLLDHTDYGTIHVFLIQPDGRKDYLCRAVNPDRTGHDRSEIAAKAKAIQDRVMREGRRELKKLSREAATEEIGREILSYRERQVENIREFPSRSEEHLPYAIEQAQLGVDAIRRAELGPLPQGITFAQERSAAEVLNLYEETGSPIVLIGMEDFARKVQAKGKFARRITQWVEFSGIDSDDAKTLAETLCDVQIADDLLDHVHQAARKNIGRMVTGLARIEQFGRLNALEKVTRKDWANRPLFYDQPRFAKRKK